MMHLLFRCLLLLIACFVLSSCDEKTIEEHAPEKELTMARDVLHKLQEKEITALIKISDPTIRSKEILAGFNRIYEILPRDHPSKIELVNYHITQLKEETVHQFLFELTYPTMWRLCDIKLRAKKDKTSLVGLHVWVQTESFEDKNRFTFEDKSLTHYLILCCAIVIPLLILYALIRCIRTPIQRWKWLWIICILMGVGNLRLDWTSGIIDWNLFHISFFGSGFVKVNYSPLFIFTSLPIGALTFLFYRPRLLLQTQINNPSQREASKKSQQELLL